MRANRDLRVMLNCAESILGEGHQAGRRLGSRCCVRWFPTPAQ